MNKARKIAIAGATGMVGQSFLKLLEKEILLVLVENKNHQSI